MRITYSGMKAAFCALSLTVLSLGCTPKEEPINPGGGGGGGSTTVPVSEVTVTPTSLTVEVGKTGSIAAAVTPTNATNKKVTWSSSDQKGATVDTGTVTGVAEGTATITATADGKSATCSVTVKPDAETAAKAALMKIYNAMDGAHWKINGKWDVSKPLNDWECVEWDSTKKELHLTFGGVGLKGEFPDCFDDLTPLTWLIVSNESGLTGTVPPSFGKLTNLKLLILERTSMTGLPDIFKDVPLDGATFIANEKMTGPFPESLGNIKTLSVLQFYSNAFTGTVPDSWANLGSKLIIEGEQYLDEQVPNSFVTAKEAGYLIGMYAKLGSDRTAPVVVGDYDIPAFWPQNKTLKDQVTEKAIPFKEIYSKNKVTVFLNWATWCSFSAEMMPMVKKMYEKYHKDGLEIIASYNASSEENDNPGKMKAVLQERGYDQWYNFNIWDFNTTEWSIWCCGTTPSAVLVDKNGNIITSGQRNVLDPTRSRYGYSASTSLISLLEEQFGPMEGDPNYSSTDYSEDGKVITIQKASTGKGINLVFMGDAYTDKDVKSGEYERLMQEAAAEFFSIEPYLSFKNRFNVYAVKVVSKNGRTGQGYTTALGTTMTGGVAGTGNREKILQYALKAPDIKDTKNLSVAVMVNSVSGGGIAEMIESLQSGIGYYSSMGNVAAGFGATLRHEMGHAFGFLADEYSTWHESPSQEVINGYTRLYETYGWYANIDFTSDPKKIKWADFLSDSRYKDEVGVFEGAINVTNGVYRPSENSMMNQNVEYFNAPSRWAIYKRIMELSGETASFSKFLEYDAINRGQQHNAPRRARSNSVEWVPDSAPVVTR